MSAVPFHPFFDFYDMLCEKTSSIRAAALIEVMRVLICFPTIGAGCVHLLVVSPPFQHESCPTIAQTLLPIPQLVHLWFGFKGMPYILSGHAAENLWLHDLLLTVEISGCPQPDIVP